MSICGKYFRVSFSANSCPSLQGAIGIYYDSYRQINGPETFEICFYFFVISVDIGKELDISELDNK